ncbi:MAG: DUF4874 domain-containing protein [Lachnospiraceae bacterium]|nr:DUF4874 domain-containing protein [Lachnospiraceae bacterium]
MFSFIKNFMTGSRKDIKLFKADLKESGEDFANPGRGWYRIYTFRLESLDYNELDWLYYDKNETLALVRIDIGAYSSRNIDNAALDFFKYILEKFHKNGKEIILRIVYDTEGKGIQKEPSLFSQVAIHMQQLGSIVKENAGNIFLFQGLFVGSWGEMHTSKFLSKEKLKILYAKWMQETGGSVKISFRTPAQVRIVKGRNSNYSDIGIFDDAIFASPTHLGTFGTGDEDRWEEPWCKDKELVFARKISEKIPCGGEAVAGESFPAPDETIRLLRDMSINYLNCIHDTRILEYWKSQDTKEYGNIYSYISMHLGYRITVKDVKLSRDGTCLKILFSNSGFSCIYFETCLELVIEEPDGNMSGKEIPFDARQLMPESITEVVIDNIGDIVNGSRLYLELLRKHDKKNIRFDNADSREMVFLGSLFIKE